MRKGEEMTEITQTKNHDKYSIASRIMRARKNNYHGKMSAKDQRELFGFYMFGKKTLNNNDFIIHFDNGFK